MNAVNFVIFEGFETLDALGPAEIFSRSPKAYELGYYSLNGGLVKSWQNFDIVTKPFSDVKDGGVLLIPGGPGTRALVDDQVYAQALAALAKAASYVLTVCTGTALLAKTGLLDGRAATTNKMAYDWVCDHGPKVRWQPKARWVVDGCIYTSSGVSAGMDMALGFLSDRHGRQTAEETARLVEYIWNSDKDNDPFAAAL